jgi:hypothetical protein
MREYVGRDFDILFGKTMIAGNEMGHQTVYLVYHTGRFIRVHGFGN